MTDVGEIVKSGAADKLADLIHKLAGPMAEEVGLMLADSIKAYRLKNWLRVAEKTKKILANSKVKPNAVPPRLLLPIIEASSVESDETLQDLWAGLLASASEQSDQLSPSLIETLKQLTPKEAKVLSDLFDEASVQALKGFVKNLWYKAAQRPAMETFERLGITRRRFDLSQPEVGTYQVPDEAEWNSEYLLNDSGGVNEDRRELHYNYVFTTYGQTVCRDVQRT